MKSISYHLNRQNYPFAGAQEPFKWWQTLRDTFSWNLKKIFGTSIFLSTSEGLLLNISETRSLLLWSFIFSISHVSSLETECTDVAVCSCFLKIGVLKNSPIFTRKHMCWSLLLIKHPAFRAKTLLKEDFNTCVFLRILQNF